MRSTQRFTAEFSIRPSLEQHPDATLRQLTAWAADPSPHVRRSVRIGFALTSTHSRGQRVLVDLAVHYVKANGQAKAKVFKLKTLELAPGQTTVLAKTLSLKEMST